LLQPLFFLSFMYCSPGALLGWEAVNPQTAAASQPLGGACKAAYAWRCQL